MEIIENSVSEADPLAAPVSVSIVIEWENASRIGAARAARCLDRLHRQLLDAPAGLIGRAEVIFVYAGGDPVEEVIRAEVERGGRQWPAEIHFLESPTDEYYQQKNFGGRRAAGEVILFLDSDVIPRHGWLESLLSTLVLHGSDVACGATSVDVEGLYSKAMALGWIFRLPPQNAGIARVRRFHANNVAMRAEVFARTPFPVSLQYRAQIDSLFDDLSATGCTILLNEAAVVDHPPPIGYRGFILRALWHGYDARSSLRQRLSAGPTFLRGLVGIGGNTVRSLARVFRDHRRVGLRLPGAVAAASIILCFFAIRLAGFMMACIAPASMRRRLQQAELNTNAAAPAQG
jgi:hypothetical protein